MPVVDSPKVIAGASSEPESAATTPPLPRLTEVVERAPTVAEFDPQLRVPLQVSASQLRGPVVHDPPS